MITVTLTFDTLIKDLKEKSHLEVASIADPAVRYKLEAGTEKDPEIKRCLDEAATDLRGEIARFLAVDQTPSSNNALPTVSAYVYDLNLSSRRSSSKADALKNAFESYVVVRSLAKFHRSVGQAELSSMYESQALAQAQSINNLLYSKLPPQV